ncbi:hypothetical protein CC78DRAFT_246208 [Lojkania enalia]|uniref:Uncharacterized protein n=1 Tax=Lojkania enalia TaxID=147567 RepID=A0A9P4KD41_9PLEO|nr:hypothetical protein CC78DRAFT_246208 [Didymosphaeria enalia]
MRRYFARASQVYLPLCAKRDTCASWHASMYYSIIPLVPVSKIRQKQIRSDDKERYLRFMHAGITILPLHTNTHRKTRINKPHTPVLLPHGNPIISKIKIKKIKIKIKNHPSLILARNRGQVVLPTLSILKNHYARRLSKTTSRDPISEMDRGRKLAASVIYEMIHHRVKQILIGCEGRSV